MIEHEMEEKMSFAELFEANPGTPDRRFFPGNTVSGKVVQIGKEAIFVDLGGKAEGMVDIKEFLDKEGNLTLREGDCLELRVASTEDGIHLTKGIKVQGADALEVLRQALESHIPVEGRVSAVKKGGFEINLSGIRAFCPLSQIDLKYCEKPEEYMGQRYQFHIMEIKEKGRDVIVSRRVLLEEEREKRLKETLDMLKPGIECEGTVTRLMEFGAFVDIGGIEGMVHISEISRARINHPSEMLKIGEEVKVRVIHIEPDKGGRPRIALSIKALEPDPWERGLLFQEGEIIRGKISRLTDFGAFVEVSPGVDGLVHLSEISYDRISHPSKLLRQGEPVDVMVMGIDYKTRRISLSIKEATAKKSMGGDEGRLEVGQILRGIVEDGKAYGLFVKLPQLGPRMRGLLPMEELRDSEKGDIKKKFPRGREIQVEIISIDDEGRIKLSQKSLEEREDRKGYEKYLEGEHKNGKLGTLGDIFKDLKLG